MRFRISNKAIFYFCLVLATLWVALLLHYFTDMSCQAGSKSESAAAPPSSPPTAPTPDVRKPGVRRWARRAVIGPEMKYPASPYNADNKRSGAKKRTGPVKLIAWSADWTMRIFSADSDVFRDCPVSACRVVAAVKSLLKASAVVFDDKRMSKQTPPQLKDERVVVYYSMRPSVEGYSSQATGPSMFTKFWKEAFTWTWSHRPDSDIFEPLAYVKHNSDVNISSAIVKKVIKAKKMLAVTINARVNKKEEGIKDIEKNLHQQQSLSGVEEYLSDFEDTAPYKTAYLVDLQRDLAKPLGVPSPQLDKLSMYHFILAFEWANCPDYVSDVLFQMYDPRVLSIPVVRGAFNYGAHLPKGTYINANDFASPAQLALYLRKLAADKRTYARMLWRKVHYTREAGLPHAWCQLCDMLHRLPLDNDRYPDIYSWIDGAQCTGGDAGNATETGGEVTGGDTDNATDMIEKVTRSDTDNATDMIEEVTRGDTDNATDTSGEVTRGDTDNATYTSGEVTWGGTVNATETGEEVSLSHSKKTPSSSPERDQLTNSSRTTPTSSPERL